MSGWRGIVVIALVAGGTALGCGSKGGSSLHSTVYGYSIAIPSGWSALSATTRLDPGGAPVLNSTATDVIAVNADRKIRSLVTPALVVGAAPVDPSTTLDAWRATVESLVGRFKGCSEPASTHDAFVGAAPAVMLTYPDCPAGSGLYHVWTVTIHGGLAYQFVWFDQQGRETANRSLLDNEMRTVRFDR